MYMPLTADWPQVCFASRPRLIFLKRLKKNAYPTFNNQVVETVDNFKHLEVTLDNQLTFDQHVSDIQKMSLQRLSAIRKLKGLYVAPHLLLLLYQSMIQLFYIALPEFLFNLIFWHAICQE